MASSHHAHPHPHIEWDRLCARQLVSETRTCASWYSVALAAAPPTPPTPPSWKVKRPGGRAASSTAEGRTGWTSEEEAGEDGHIFRLSETVAPGGGRAITDHVHCTACVASAQKAALHNCLQMGAVGERPAALGSHRCRCPGGDRKCARREINAIVAFTPVVSPPCATASSYINVWWRAPLRRSSDTPRAAPSREPSACLCAPAPLPWP